MDATKIPPEAVKRTSALISGDSSAIPVNAIRDGSFAGLDVSTNPRVFSLRGFRRKCWFLRGICPRLKHWKFVGMNQRLWLILRIFTVERP
jgi:hypothetical protein